MIWKSPGLDNKKNPLPGDSSRDPTNDPLFGGHQQPFKGSRFRHPKKVTSRIARYFKFLVKTPIFSSPLVTKSSGFVSKDSLQNLSTKRLFLVSEFDLKKKLIRMEDPRRFLPGSGFCQSRKVSLREKKKAERKRRFGCLFLRKRSGMIGVSDFFFN